MSQEKLTTVMPTESSDHCPVQAFLKLLAGKWKPEIFRLAMAAPLRLSTLLRQIPASNKQTLSVALRELEESGLLQKTVISQKPLHIEYTLTERGAQLIPVFRELEQISGTG